jgi:hypothetical protein
MQMCVYTKGLPTNAHGDESVHGGREDGQMGQGRQLHTSMDLYFNEL